MYFAIFEGTELEGKAEVSEQYYKALSPILREIKGFISETGFGSPHTNRLGVLISVWEDADAISRWRNQATHLRIQKKANQDVYEDYRIRIGPELDNNISAETSLDEGSPVVLLYYRESLETTPEDDITSLVESTVATEIQSHLLGSTVYLGPQTLWISSWQSEKVARQFASLLPRIQNDDLKVVRTQRDYTKSRRTDAPSEKAGSL
jgi:heme-degrading monooxygenase HmoA